MRDTDYIAIPLRRRDGAVRAYAKIDYEDAALAELRWSWGAQYARRTVREDGGFRLYILHRVILGLAHGDPREGDHINLDKLDNRRSNLRIVTGAQNRQNRPSSAGSSSRFRGVFWHKHKRRWVAMVWVGPKAHWLGAFHSEEEAAAVASRFRSIHMPYSAEDQ
jgi:hypothetical protein